MNQYPNQALERAKNQAAIELTALVGLYFNLWFGALHVVYQYELAHQEES